MKKSFLSTFTLLLGFLAHDLPAETKIVLIPEKVELRGSTAWQGVLVQKLENGRHAGQVTNGFALKSSDENVVRIENDRLIPVGNGRAEISAEIAGQKLASQVRVSEMDQHFQWSFRNHVQPVLAKTGCSSGACHGAAAGQGGFRLSLRGYDNEGDWKSITQSAMGRRIVPAEPAHSLLLLKPTTAVPHKGGERFSTNSLEYRIVSEWIASGSPGPGKNEPKISRLEIIPDKFTLKQNDAQQLLVQAYFSDGSVFDVTRWVKFTDANASVTQVDEQGKVKILGHGEGAVTAWYLSKLSIATFTVPYTNQVDPAVFSKADRKNLIDQEVLEKLQELNLPPSSRCTDAEFVRRAHLDTIGMLPTAEEAQKFIQNNDPEKRTNLIKSLFSKPEFVDYWAYKWSDLLLVSSKRLPDPAMWSYYRWVRNSVAANKPWDQMVREITTARGSTMENGAANFYLLHDEPTLMAENVTQAFLGMSINCAKCHNHPMEKWTNDDYFAFANLFSRVRVKSGSDGVEKFLFSTDAGNLIQPLTGKPRQPAPLEGSPISLDATNDRRETMANWLTSPENPYFTRSIVNRVWANFFGVGLVDKVDDLRVSNPASNEKLLSAVARFLAGKNYDLRELMKLILESETYQRSSVSTPENAGDKRFYSHFYPRRLMAEVLLDAYSQISEVPTEFRVDLRSANQGLGKTYPAKLRAVQLPDSKVFSYFLKTFGRPEREKTCECERTSEPSLAQVLHVANGDTLNQKLSSTNSALTRLTAAEFKPERLVDQLFLGALSRYPTPGEKERLTAALNKSSSPAEQRLALEDAYWAVLSSKEFLFNH